MEARSTNSLEFSYNAEKVREQAGYLDTAMSRMNDFNLSSLITQLQNCRGWSRLSSADSYISLLNGHKNDATNYKAEITKEKNRILDTLVALENFDGEVVTTETNFWADLAMAYYNFEEGFLTGFEQVLDGLMTGAAVVCGWVGLDGAADALAKAVDYEIIGEFYDWRFENDPFMQLVEKHATYNHDDPRAEIAKGFGTIVSYVAMAALAGGGLGALGVSGGAWSGAASVLGDMLVTGIGTLGAETDKGLERGEDIMTAAWNAADDALLATFVSGTVGGFMEFAPGMFKTVGTKVFGEATQEGAEAALKEGAQTISTETAQRLADEGVEEFTTVTIKNSAGQTIEMTSDEFLQVCVKSNKTPNQVLQEFADQGIDVTSQKWTLASTGDYIIDAAKPGLGDTLGEGGQLLLTDGSQTVVNEAAQTMTNESGQLLLTDGSQTALNETAQSFTNETTQQVAEEGFEVAGREGAQTATNESMQQTTDSFTSRAQDKLQEIKTNAQESFALPDDIGRNTLEVGAGEAMEEVETKVIKETAQQLEEGGANRTKDAITDAIGTGANGTIGVADNVIIGNADNAITHIDDVVPTNSMDEFMVSSPRNVEIEVPTNQTREIAEEAFDRGSREVGQELSEQTVTTTTKETVEETIETGLEVTGREATEEAIETGMEVAGREATEEAIETGVEVAGREATEEAIETGMEVAGREATEEAIETGMEVAGREATEEAIETGMEVAGREATEEAIETGLTIGGKEVIEEVVEEAGEQGLKQTFKKAGVVAAIANRDDGEMPTTDESVFDEISTEDNIPEFPTEKTTELPSEGILEIETDPETEIPSTGILEIGSEIPTEGPTIPEIPTDGILEIETDPSTESPTTPTTESKTDPKTEPDTGTGSTGGEEEPTNPPTTPDDNTGEDILGDVVPTGGQDSESTSISEQFRGIEGSLGDIVDLAGGVNIPTSADPIRTTVNTKDNKMIPLMAGLGAAAIAGLGTKAYLERKENKDDEDEIEAEEWDEDESVDLALDNENYGAELEESDYLTPNDEYAYAPETADIESDDDGNKYEAVNSSELPSMN